MSGADDVALRCACGAFTGTLHGAQPGVGLRLVCYCDDCQCWAHHLDRAPEVLDAQGGTEVFQTWPGLVSFDQGAEHVGAARLSPKGPLRWYATCCRTPIANGFPTRGWAFASLLRPILDLDDAGRDARLGPVRARVQARFARGEPPAGAQPSVALPTLARSLAHVAVGRLRGRHSPSPFFGPDGRPVVPPTLLSKAARDALRARAGFPGGQAGAAP